jgi:hypothetical protein
MVNNEKKSSIFDLLKIPIALLILPVIILLGISVAAPFFGMHYFPGSNLTEDLGKYSEFNILNFGTKGNYVEVAVIFGCMDYQVFNATDIRTDIDQYNWSTVTCRTNHFELKVPYLSNPKMTEKWGRTNGNATIEVTINEENQTVTFNSVKPYTIAIRAFASKHQNGDMITGRVIGGIKAFEN